MTRTWVLRILFALVALNILNFCFYLLHSDPPRHGASLPAPKNPVIEQRGSSFDQTKVDSFGGKPWPDLPSYVPWVSNPNLGSESCEAYFGNGFNRLFRVWDPLGDGRKIKAKAKAGRFSCAYSRALRTSICQANRMVMHPDRIAMSRGGEDIDSVIGRDEGDEIPSYSEGAFEIEAGDHEIGDGRVVSRELLDQIMPQGVVQIHTMRSLLLSLRRVPSKDVVCSQWIEEPTLFVTRFEYANLFHTVTDWYSAYVTSRVSGLPNRPHLVFVDGHCKSPMDEAWEALFSSITYAKHFSGTVCFRHAIFTPLGYETALFKGLSDTITCYGCSVSELKHNPDDRRTARLIEFGEMFRAAFYLLSGGQISSQSSGQNVLFLRREDYLAHPRHRGKVESRLANEEEVLVALEKWAANHSKCKVNIVNGLFAHMEMMDQVQAVQAASVIVGAHGAALTHVIGAKRGTVVLEIMSSLYKRPHFELISQWTGLQYHVINMQALIANCSEVVKVLGEILNSLGC